MASFLPYLIFALRQVELMIQGERLTFSQNLCSNTEHQDLLPVNGFEKSSK
jgi:hypothetical protein